MMDSINVIEASNYVSQPINAFKVTNGKKFGLINKLRKDNDDMMKKI